MNFKNMSVTLSVIFPLSFSPSNISQSSLTTLCMYNTWVLLLTVDALSTREQIFCTASPVMLYSGTQTEATWDPQVIKYSRRVSQELYV